MLRWLGIGPVGAFVAVVVLASGVAALVGAPLVLSVPAAWLVGRQAGKMANRFGRR